MFDRAKFQELQQLGAKQVQYLPCAFDPDVYHPKPISPTDVKNYQCDIGMIASYYKKRGEILSAVQGLDVAIWGMGWKKSPELKQFPSGTLRGKSLTGRQIATAYNVIKICPNAHHSQSILGGLNMRAFEIPGAGGFQITDYIEGMEEHFEIGKEIVVYQSPEHFRELAEYYLKHDDERKAIAKRGYERVIRDHTYQQRLKKIFGVLKS
ncbi:MAG: glycosyltransferase [Nitrososphaerota archaeon]